MITFQKWKLKSLPQDVVEDQPKELFMNHTKKIKLFVDLISIDFIE